MRSTIVRLFALLVLFAVTSAAYSAFVFQSLPSPPKASNIGEIKFDRSDASANNSESISLSREEFLKFFEEGLFLNDAASLDRVYRSDHYKKPLNAEGGWMYCSGAFATKDGNIFTFTRPRIGVLEISDANYQSGFLVLPEHE